MEIVDEKVVSWAEAKKILEKKSKEKELGYEQKNALDHLKKFSKLSIKNEENIIESLKKIDKLKDRQIILLVNTLPETQEDVKILFSNEVINLSEDESKKVVSVIKKFS
ncbi:MAG: hypothetical protein KKG13_03355 [Nanoarchaeota archaeon]|nr:hypothetical protein [Nanoarchaeota archaeon]